MIDIVSKPKLPKGFSYVLESSQLEKALFDEAIDCDIDLCYWTPQSGGSILEGRYRTPNENALFPRVYVRAGVVPSALRGAASKALLEIVLPQFAVWLRWVFALADESPTLHEILYFDAAYTEKGLSIAYQKRTRKGDKLVFRKRWPVKPGRGR